MKGKMLSIGFLVGLFLVVGTAWGMGKKPKVLDALLDEQTVAAGLREALRVATERTVKSTSKLDGFLGNALIRIVM